jgi:hypothetical protein
MNNTIKPLFFIHIPKTAGSSFRKAAESYFGKALTFYDYGPEYKDTHPKITEYEYMNMDRFAAGSYIISHARFLSGHVPYSKYAPFFHPSNIITFIRSPEQQIRSHFEHFINLHGYKNSFKEFILEKRFTNMQSRMLNGIGIEGIGFVGLTEEYETSVALINRIYKTDFKTLQINTNQQKKLPSYILNAKELELIHTHNQEDIELYRKACIRFERQKKSVENSTNFIRFSLLHLPPKQALHKINGWLTCYELENALELAIFINGKYVEKITANEYRATANERNINRSGYIGFTYNIPNGLKHNDLIEFYATLTDELVYSTIFNQTIA